MTNTKIIRCVDIETSSLKDPPESAVCEIGWQDVVMEQDDAGEWKPSLVPDDGGGSCFVDPGMPIEPEARAIHHINDGALVGAVDLAQAVEAHLAGADIYAAHHSAFEKKYLGAMLDKPWLCTLKASRRVWPDAPAHGLQVLRYWRRWQGIDNASASPAHRAGPDAYVNALILVDLLIEAGTSVRQMIEWEGMPSLLPGLIRFGKHKGIAWADAPIDYLGWLANKSDMDEDTKFTARHWIASKHEALANA